MGTFFKTFFICLILAFSFLAYKCLLSDSFSPELTISQQSPIFGNHKDLGKSENIKQDPEETEIKPENPKQEETIQQEKKETKYKHTCYFYSPKGELIAVTRELKTQPTLESTILLLLKGPTISESKQGMYSEIPANVDLINVKKTDNKIIVNLSSNFGNGGGSESIENRVKQLAKTIKKFSPKKDIYLYINNKEVEYLGGEGVYIKQPL